MECGIEDVVSHLDVSKFPAWAPHVASLKPAFDYLNARLLNTCEPAYYCGEMYEIMRLVQIFNPTFAAANHSINFTEELSGIKPLVRHNLLAALKLEMPAYLKAAKAAPVIDTSSVHDFTEAVLTFWRLNQAKFSKWAEAARIIFAFGGYGRKCREAAYEVG
jgi:hypothetical protein